MSSEDIDEVFVGNFAGELFVRQGHLGSAVGNVPGLMYKPSTRVEGACASGGLAFASGVRAIQAGCDLVAVTGVEVQSTVSARECGTFLARILTDERSQSMPPEDVMAIREQYYL